MAKCNDPKKAKAGQTWYVVRGTTMTVYSLVTALDAQVFKVLIVPDSIGFTPRLAISPSKYFTRSKRKAYSRVQQERLKLESLMFEWHVAPGRIIRSFEPDFSLVNTDSTDFTEAMKLVSARAKELGQKFVITSASFGNALVKAPVIARDPAARVEVLGMPEDLLKARAEHNLKTVWIDEIGEDEEA